MAYSEKKQTSISLSIFNTNIMLIYILINYAVGYIGKKGFTNSIIFISQFLHLLHYNYIFSLLQITTKKLSSTTIKDVVYHFLMQVKVSTIKFE